MKKTKRRSYMPRLMPNEHLLSAICRGIQLGTANHWRDFLADPKCDGSQFCSGHVLRPLYASVCTQYNGTTTETILRNHSLWNYFHSFLPSQTGEIPAPESWTSIYNHKHVLHPIKLVRYRHTKQWRWCPDCCADDHEKYGITYWHIEHQLPGVTHCLNHPETQLKGACNSCGSQITSILNNEIRLHNDNKCPICHSSNLDEEYVPEHPVIDWVQQTTLKLNAGARFDTEGLREDILSELGINPGQRTAAGIRTTKIARKMIFGTLPIEVINCFFQTENRGAYQAGDHISPLCLRLLYDRSNFIHPLSWLVIGWIVLSGSTRLESYLIE